MTEQLRISNSSIKTLQRCEQQYAYKYVENLSPKRVALPLKLGTWVHSLLEAKYRDGTWKTAFKRLEREYAKLFQQEREFYGDLPTQTREIMRGYDYHWRGDDEEWKVIETERKLEIPLSSTWLYVAKLDVIAENDEGVWIWDHKTFKAKKPSDDYRTSDPQSALYDWAWEQVSGQKAVGFIFNYLRTKAPSVPPLLKNGSISKARNIDTNWVTLARTIKQYGLNPADYREQLSAARARDRLFFDRVYIPKPVNVIRELLKDIQTLVPRIRSLHEGRRPTRTLTYDCERFCPYHLLCLTELVGGDGSYIKKHDFTNRAWEEYEDGPTNEE